MNGVEAWVMGSAVVALVLLVTLMLGLPSDDFGGSDSRGDREDDPDEERLDPWSIPGRRPLHEDGALGPHVSRGQAVRAPSPQCVVGPASPRRGGSNRSECERGRSRSGCPGRFVRFFAG